MVFRSALVTFLVAGVVGCGFGTPAPTEKLPEVFFATEQSLTDESITSTEIVVKLSMKTFDEVRVGYSMSGGSAVAGRDVNDTDGEIVFAPLEDTARIKLAIVDDNMEEPEESVEIELQSPVNAELGQVSEHTVLISANKLPRVRFVTAASSAREDISAQTFAVQLDTPSPTDVVVRYTWAGSTEVGDHGVVDGFVRIPANQLSQAIPAAITNDPTDEDDETIDLTLIAQAGAVVAPGLGEHSHTIVDDDPPPTIGFAPATSSSAEGTGTVMLAVSLGLASEKQITIAYASAAGGTAGTDDYAVTASTLTFPPGTTTLMVPVTLTADALDEDDESAEVALASPSNATLQAATTRHTLTITDDDAEPTLEFAAAASSAPEATATHSITVRLSAASGRPVQFSLSRGGTSTIADLTVPATPLTIPAGMTMFSFNVIVINDTVNDDDETAVLTLTSLSNATPGTQTSHTITIADDDTGPPPGLWIEPELAP